MIFQGSAPALITPFKGGKVDFAALEKLIEFQIEGGSDALVMCGTTGEPSTMTLAEEEQVAKAAIAQVAGRIPVIVGIGGNATQEVLDAAALMTAAGADALLAVTPYYNKTTQAGLIAHYSVVAESTPLPIIVYNVPGRTGLNINPSTVVELAEVPNIVAIKEASGNLDQIMELARVARGRIDIYSGNDDQVFPLVALGAKGVISVAANLLPRQMHNIATWTLEGDYERARNLQLDLLPLINALFMEVSPIPAKAALEMMGMIDGELRLPLVPMSEPGKAVLRERLLELDLLP